MQRFLIFLLPLLLLQSATAQLFAYERGKCEISIVNVLEGLAQTHLRNLLNPPPRRITNQASLLQYDLYTPLNPQQRQLLQPGNVNMLKNSNFNGKWPLRLIIHGWTGKSTHCYNAAVKDAYLSRGNFNVIVMDWSHQAMDLSYYRVSKQLPSIAQSLAKFLRFLHDNTGLRYEQIYLVGHSAGSHIAGLTGKLLQPARLGVIFALDPAGLNQLDLGPTERLAPTDALYVESIHTDLMLLGNPQADRLSHAATFANWGRGQTHCPNATATEFDFACDHFAAVYYFAESVRRPHNFGALRCNSLRSALKAKCSCSAGQRTCAANASMGGEPAVPKRGIYYLSTRRQPPYGTADGLVHMQLPRPSTILLTRPKLL
ncbi:sxe2 [Drosophila busckii]|uniref:Sxe2 n=1 Tax=Drosophila busckii TaxID=30019 RepID=A0A0M5J8S6_DROBS|nr:lipase member H [Drosophila busckii]ALC45348.1 sxe2 [Drosophila busckii]